MGAIQPAWTRTEKQAQAIDYMCSALHTMLYGGSRSGKTFITCYAIVARALKVKSRHLIVRFRFNHVKTSIWYDTFPKVMAICFPGVPFKKNKSDWYVEFANGSQIWFGGIDDKERTEKVLGNEYSTIYANESSQISYDAILMLHTRLAENTPLNKRFFYDCNPPSKKHWSYKLFVEHISPVDGSPVDPEMYACLQMNPGDNAANLPEGYIEDILARLPKRQRDRFLHGMFLIDVEGALWDFDMIANARNREFGTKEITVVGVDPSITNQENSDLCGIVVASKESTGGAVVEKDYSLRASPNQWAQTAVNAYHEHEASAIIAEVNQGGDMVETIINNIDSSVRIVKVRASKGKFARAEPISALYEQGLISHEDGLDELENEMLEYVPISSKKSPDRLDAMVWALTHLMLTKAPEPMIRVF